jgi:hypothetical protein
MEQSNKKKKTKEALIITFLVIGAVVVIISFSSENKEAPRIQSRAYSDLSERERILEKFADQTRSRELIVSNREDLLSRFGNNSTRAGRTRNVEDLMSRFSTEQ